MRIPIFALSGGPCGGKSTGLIHLSEKLTEYGHRLLIVPEAATLLIQSGITPSVLLGEAFQEHVFRTALFLEDETKRAALAMKNESPVIICDRGLMDARAYVSQEVFAEVATRCGFNSTVDIRDGRYDAVFYMQTAAKGAEKFYTTINNSARRETAEEARILDDTTFAAWNGHPHIWIIDNRADGFEGKLTRLLQAVCHSLGIPVPLEIEKKFLIARPDLNTLPVPWEAIDIEQVYLTSSVPGEELRVRKRGQHGAYVYYRTVKQTLGRGIRAEREETITPKEYAEALKSQDQFTVPVRKQRICFAYKHQYCELDLFSEPSASLAILEIELTNKTDTVAFPPFLTCIEDVTEKVQYTNWSIARGL